MKLDARITVMNLLNQFYITDAQNNNFNNDFNASAARVNVGMGRRWLVSLVASF
jgi:outer membrane receptor protein involved in Fe transport